MLVIASAAFAVTANVALIASVGLNLFSHSTYQKQVHRGLAIATVVFSAIALVLSPFGV